MSFWYGLPVGDIVEMPYTTIEAYLDRLPARQAELKLIMADAASLPHMKEHDRKRMHSAWLREARPVGQVARPATPAILKMMGIGVRHGKQK